MTNRKISWNNYINRTDIIAYLQATVVPTVVVIGS